MKELYEKNELNFALIWIGIYVVLASIGDSVSASLGIVKSVTAPICIVLTIVMYGWICKNELKEKYGLCSMKEHTKKYIYIIPLVVLIAYQFVWGFKMNLTVIESVFYVISMLCVGFLEEVIFRGFLFTVIFYKGKSLCHVSSPIVFLTV